MAVRRGFSRGGRGFRPATFWAGSTPAAQTAVPAASKVIVASFTNSGDQDLTVRRIRGLLTVASDQQVATELQLGAFGATVVTDAATAVGATAVPDPVTEVADDMWMLYVHIGQQMRFASAVGLEPNWVTQYVLDSKAMRKTPAGYSLIFVIANSASTGFNATLGVRFLSSITGR